MKSILQKFQEGLNGVTQYQNNALLVRYTQLYNLPMDTAQSHFEDLKKFLLLCSVSDEPQSPAHQLDEIWHTFILFTKDYHHFCTTYLGKFIHHTPEVLMDDMQEKQSPKNYVKTRNFANAHFGKVCHDLWPDPQKTPVAEICRSANGCGNGGNCSGNSGQERSNCSGGGGCQD